MVNAPDSWVVVLSRGGDDGRIQDDVRSWLRASGTDWNPFTVEEAQYDTYAHEARERSHGPFSVRESALRRVIGSRKVMAAQLRHLADLISYPNVDIRVLPFRAGLPVGMSTGPFLILDFDVDKKGKPEEPSVVFVESFTGGTFLERLVDLARYREAYEVIQRGALDVQPSRDLLREVAKEYERGR